MSNQHSNQTVIPPAPVLLIGCGGSGKGTVLVSNPANQKLFKAGQLLWLVQDSDPTGKEQLDKNFYEMKNCPTHSLIEQIRQNPDSFPGHEHLGDLGQLKKAAGPTQHLSRGSQGCRGWGKAGLMWELKNNQADYLDFYAQHISALKPAGKQAEVSGRNGSMASDSDETLPQAQILLPLEIRLIGSAAGGCASGQLIDMGWLLDYVCRYKVGVKHFEVSLDLVLSNCFRHDNQQLLQANEMAFLLELMEAYEQPFLTPLQSGSVRLDRPRPPFAHITLWSRTTASDRVYQSREEVHQVMAECLRMKTEGAIGAEYRGQLVNLANVEPPNIFQADGCYRLTLEIEAMQRLGGFRLARRLVVQYLLRHQDDEAAETQGQYEAQDFSHQIGLNNQARVFARDDTGRPITISLDAFARAPRDRLPGILADFERKALPKATETVRQLGQAEAKRVANALVEQIERLLNAPDGGVCQVTAFLKALNYQLSQQQNRVRQQRQRTEHELERWHQEQAQRQKNPLKRIAANMRQSYLTRMEQKMGLQLQILKLAAQQELQAALQTQIETQLQAVARWVAASEHLVQQLHLQEVAFSRDREAQRPVCVYHVLPPTQEQHEIAQHLEKVWVNAQQGIRFAWNGDGFVLAYGSKSAAKATSPHALWEAAGVSEFANYATGFFDGLSDLSIETVLSKNSQKTAAEVLERMAQRAAPLVQLDEMVQQPPPRKLIFFASTTGAKGYFQPAARNANWTCIASGDPHNVELLISWHHINPWALQSIPLLREAYDALKHREALHVFDTWHNRLKQEREMAAE